MFPADSAEVGSCAYVILFLQFATRVVNIREVIVDGADQAFVLVEFVVSKKFNFDPLVV